MRRGIRLLIRVCVLLFVVVPVCAWLIVKPVRVLAPRLVSVSCPTASICVDDVARYQEAEGLYSEAIAFVAAAVDPIEGKPKVVFCSTDACAQSFGLGARSAVTLGEFGTVVSPRAWLPYYVRHEMIHYLQSERIGMFSLLFKPSWFVEGMAYSLSQDSRKPLVEPFESYRSSFLNWYGQLDKRSVWEKARRL